MSDDDITQEALARSLRKLRRETEDRLEELEGQLQVFGTKQTPTPTPTPSKEEPDDDGGIPSLLD